MSARNFGLTPVTKQGGDTLTISVIITCFNEGRFLNAAVNSVLGQTRSDLIDRIIVCDDGSDAETQIVLRSLPFRDPRISLLPADPLKVAGVRGVSRNRNRGVAATQSPLIAFLDADDIWQPTKIEQQIAVLLATPTTSLVYTGFWLFWSDGRAPPTIAPLVDLSDEADQALAFFLNDPPIVPSTVLMRRTLWDQLGGFDEKLEVFEDTEFFFRSTVHGRAAAVTTPLIEKRLHELAVTSNRSQLMKHHAYVAFHVAGQNPRLLRYVAERLSERARKLGNLEALDGNRESAANLLASAISLNPFNFRAWVTFVLHYFGGASALRAAKLTFARVGRP
jgi:glycosyltransferase involved in cell wall biosynthesis